MELELLSAIIFARFIPGVKVNLSAGFETNQECVGITKN
jgi:hypothetical protein